MKIQLSCYNELALMTRLKLDNHNSAQNLKSANPLDKQWSAYLLEGHTRIAVLAEENQLLTSRRIELETHLMALIKGVDSSRPLQQYSSFAD